MGDKRKRVRGDTRDVARKCVEGEGDKYNITIYKLPKWECPNQRNGAMVAHTNGTGMGIHCLIHRYKRDLEGHLGSLGLFATYDRNHHPTGQSPYFFALLVH